MLNENKQEIGSPFFIRRRRSSVLVLVQEEKTLEIAPLLKKFCTLTNLAKVLLKSSHFQDEKVKEQNTGR